MWSMWLRLWLLLLSLVVVVVVVVVMVGAAAAVGGGPGWSATPVKYAFTASVSITAVLVAALSVSRVWFLFE